jgi:Methyltransferase domain
MSHDLPQHQRSVTVLISDFSDVSLPSLAPVEGMTSMAECRYLFWLAATQLSGAGQLVEIGSWLGRSTLHLAAGLSQSGHARHIHCFDGFTWAPSDPGKSKLPLKPGDNFQKFFEANVSAFANLVTAHRTQIAEIAWKGEPVELLFLDAPKKHQEITRCLEVFGPTLIPGQSIIAIQDYLYFPAYALAACMYALRNHLELAHVVLDGSTVAFRVTRAIDLRDDRPADWDIRRWSPEKVEENWEAILAPLPEKARNRLEPAKALHLYDCGAKSAAIAAMQALPMTAFQQERIELLARSHHYLSYPELFTAVGHPGTLKQNLMAQAKRLRDHLRGGA